MDKGQRELTWVKLSRFKWCRLLELDLEQIRAYGVYIIWNGKPSQTLRVGHGDIAEELRACREDPRITGHLGEGPLFVTWADVDAYDAAGIALYLAETLHPLIEDRIPYRVSAIAARAPF